MDWDERELKPYKGYNISKCYYIGITGKRKKIDPFYLVSNDEDYIGEEYKTLKEAKRFIDYITQ